MTQIVIATANSDKFVEIKNIWSRLENIDIIPLSNYPLIDDIEENGATLEENAFIKASEVSRISELPAVSDDTGLFVDALAGRPGVYSARYAGENASYAANVKKLLEELSGIPQAERSAQFKTVVCLVRPGLKPVYAYGHVDGYITLEPQGDKGFGYDPVFQIKDREITYAEMSSAEKNTMSHRFQAFNNMADIISLSYF